MVEDAPRLADVVGATPEIEQSRALGFDTKELNGLGALDRGQEVLTIGGEADARKVA